MPIHTLRTLDDCLSADTAVARLAVHAERLLKLQRLLEQTLPTALAQSCRIANYKLGKILIHADSSAIAAKLRQIAPSLGDAFAQNCVEVTEIRVRVQPRFHETIRSPAKQIAPIGLEAEHGLTSLMTSLPEDSPLRTALERLLAKNREDITD